MLVMGLVAWAILALFVALAEAGEVKVTVPRQPNLEVIDLFTNKVVARLDAGPSTSSLDGTSRGGSTTCGWQVTDSSCFEGELMSRPSKPDHQVDIGIKGK